MYFLTSYFGAMYPLISSPSGYFRLTPCPSEISCVDCL
uniref:Uncharacterized protein n=1 Tax=Arundo donax TaxID=35708 RepID=A0A0A8Z0L5_ARUDO